MKLIKKMLAFGLFTIIGLIGLSAFHPVFAQNMYDETLNSSIQGSATSQHLIKGVDGTGVEAVNNQIFSLIGYAINILIGIGLIVALIGGYSIMVSNKEDSVQGGVRMLVYGIIGIILMVSAKFIGTALVGDNGILSKYSGDEGIKGIELAQHVYDDIMYPFIKIILYIIVGILFIFMAIKVINFALATDDSAKKKAGGIILRSAIGILIIMGSKQIVEGVMGKQEAITEATNVEKLQEIGNGFLDFETVPIISQIINWAMGLAMLVVLVLIVIQGYSIIAHPDDSKTRDKLKKTLLYVVIGVLVIGASYVISNLLIVNNVS